MKQLKNGMKRYKQWQHRLNVMGLSLLMSTPAYASTDISAITNALQGLVDILSGATANLAATVAVAGLGYGWLTSRISLAKAGTIALGIGMIIGAADIVSAVT